MSLNLNDLDTLKTNSLSFENARELANQISNDLTFGGVFPNGDRGDFTNPDKLKFKNKFCPAWPVLKKTLIIARIFTNSKIDMVIDAIINLGDNICLNETAS